MFFIGLTLLSGNLLQGGFYIIKIITIDGISIFKTGRQIKRGLTQNFRPLFFKKISLNNLKDH